MTDRGSGRRGIIDETTRHRYELAGFGKPIGMGSRPALLIIDVQYRTIGTTPAPFEDAVGEFTTSCGEVGHGRGEAHRRAGRAVPLKELADPISARRTQAVRTTPAPSAAKVPGIMDVPARGYDFVEEVAPADGDVLLPKRHPSAFFGTPLASYLVEAGADTLVVTGCTTSGCVRSSVADAFSYNFR